MSSSCSPSHVLIALPNKRTIQISMKLLMSTKIIKTTTIINCGATKNFIDCDLLALMKFPYQHLKWPIKAYNMDGITNSKGNIGWKADVLIWFPTHKEKVKLMVLSLGQKQITLEVPWLQKWNPQINSTTNILIIPWAFWIRDIVSLCECLLLMNNFIVPQRYLLQWLGLDTDQKISSRLQKRKQWLTGKTVGKTTIST